MNTKIILAFLSLLAFMPAMAQNSSEKEKLLREISELEAEIARLKNSSSSEQANVYCYEKTMYTQLQPMNDHQFTSFCVQELAKINDLPTTVEDRIISSCRNEGSIVNASFCVIHNPNVNLLLNSDQKQLLKEKAVAQEEKLAREKKLKKIRNTKKMYQNLIETLNKEIAANAIEVVDNGGNLVVKHVNLKQLDDFREVLQKLKDLGVEKLKESYGLEDRPSIENETADIVEQGINITEELASVVPGGDKITCHYLWRIFKSIPDVGKMLGNSGAIINIMFQRNEYEKKLKELEQQEKELLKD
jgi:hypothetical protein